MNILLINHYAGSPRHGMEYRPYYLAREWVDLGHRVTVAAASFAHVRRQQPVCDGPYREETIDRIRYVWLRTPAYRGNGLGRVRNMLTFLYRLARHATAVVGTSPPDAVIASSTYPLDIYPANRLARKHCAVLIFEVHDLWPLSPKELGGMPSWHPFIVAMQRAEDFACRRADKVVSILPKADAHLVTRGMAREKFVHVPNGISVEEWERADQQLPAETIQLLQRERAKGHLLVGYAGAHGLANALHVLVEAACRLRTAPVTFVLVGQGPEKESLRRQVGARRLNNVLLLPPVPRDSVPAFTRNMDALYIGLARQPLFRFGISPNKLFDYMMAGRPIVHAIEAGNDLVAESDCGLSVAAEDPDAVARAIQTLVELPAEKREAMGMRGRNYVLRRHDYQVLARSFLEVLQDAREAGGAAANQVRLSGAA